jgi:hypothetical protein
MKYRRAASSLAMVLSGVLLAQAESNNPPGGYDPRYLADDTTFVLAKIGPSEVNGGIRSQHLTVLSDLKGQLKASDSIAIQSAQIFISDYEVPPAQPKDAIVFWAVTTTKKAGIYWFLRSDNAGYPIGIAPEDTVPASEVEDAKAAMKEFADALHAPDHAGPTHERALQLLKDKNYYKWSLGVWRLAHEAHPEDVAKLEALFQEEITPRQALWLDRVLQWDITGEFVEKRPTPDELHRLLQDYLARFIRAHPLEASALKAAGNPEEWLNSQRKSEKK